MGETAIFDREEENKVSVEWMDGARKLEYAENWSMRRIGRLTASSPNIAGQYVRIQSCDCCKEIRRQVPQTYRPLP